jgi:CheY-like chemotaxis protein
VLVVEDTPVHALLIERILSKRGVKNIVRTSSGEDAIRLLSLSREGKALKPDLVLLDLQLPGVSGFHVLETIKSAGALRSIPVVVLSCSDSDADVSRCMEAGANAFVSKAESYDNLRQSILRITDFWSQVRKVG